VGKYGEETYFIPRMILESHEREKKLKSANE